MTPPLRPMTGEDAPGVLDCSIAAFRDLEQRFGEPVTPSPANREPGLARIRHLVERDPGGAWVTERDGAITGAALALVREGLWGLSLLVVEPGVQSGGAGSALLAAALDYGAGTRGGLILASQDPRALRIYARAGFELRPSIDVRGTPREPVEAPDAVRPLDWPRDRELIDRVGRAVRGAGHGGDVPIWLRAGAKVVVHDEGGFGVAVGGDVKLVAGEREDVAADVLRAVLAGVGAGEEVSLDFVTAGQDWAVGVALEARLRLQMGGAVFARGEVGPMRPYVPSGAYL